MKIIGISIASTYKMNSPENGDSNNSFEDAMGGGGGGPPENGGGEDGWGWRGRGGPGFRGGPPRLVMNPVTQSTNRLHMILSVGPSVRNHFAFSSFLPP